MPTMATKLLEADEAIRAATEDEGKDAFDFTCRYFLNMPGADFLELWDAGKIDPTLPNLSSVLTMLPFVGRSAR